jgi:hypothetical protein
LSAGGEDVPLERRVKGFMPFCRLSHNLLAACDARYREGLSGHSEVIWPTIASLAGLLLEDIGGSGSFTPVARRGRYYRRSGRSFRAPSSFGHPSRTAISSERSVTSRARYGIR